MEKEKIKSFLKKRSNQLLVLLLGITIILRLYYFIKLGAQPVWWDEGDYLAIAKVWSAGMETPEWWAHFTGMRPVLLPILWAALFKIGLGELSLRFLTLLIPGIASVYVLYLIGKILYNGSVGLIAGTMLSVYWVWFFYSFRLLTDIPSVFLGLLSLFYFLIYMKENKNYGLYLCLIFGVLGFSTRFPIALVLMVCALYLLVIRKFKIFKDKTMWKALGLLILLITPYLIYFISTNFFLFQFYFGESAVSIKNPIAWYIFPFSLGLIHSIWIIAFVIGLLTMIPLIIGLDVLWKQKDKSLNSDFFLVLLLLVHYIFYIIIFRAANDRWLLMLMPAIFLIAAKGIMATYKFAKPYSKTMASILLVILLFGGVYQNITHSIDLTEQKIGSYGGVKEAGLWLKQNAPSDSRIITASIVQNQYYSERQSYDFFTNASIWKECQDLYGQLSTDPSCQEKTEQEFNKKIQDVGADYLIVSGFEPVFTPQWAYTYGDRYNLSAVYAYPQNQQAEIVIYRF